MKLSNLSSPLFSFAKRVGLAGLVGHVRLGRLAGGALALTVAACSADAEAPSTGVVRSALARNAAPAVTNDGLARFSKDQAAFAVDLYQAVRRTPAHADADIFLSPQSISTALAMTYAGARGQTKSEMKTALHFGLEDADLHTAFNWLDLTLTSRNIDGSAYAHARRLATVNSVWGQSGSAFEAPFLDALAVNYGAGMNVVDFARAPQRARAGINAWVEDKTEDRIKDLVPPSAIDPRTRLVLVNAVYFSAAWAKAFTASATAPATFTKLDGSTVQVPTMHDLAPRSYLAGDDFEAVSLPYEGSDLSMLVVAPKAGAFATFEDNLTGDKMLDVLAGLEEREVDLALPKVSLDAAFELGAPLGALGMKTAFTDSADFSGIGAGALSIKSVFHKTFLAIDETGTEAAAASAVVVGTRHAVITEGAPVKMNVDRPFLVAIVDEPTKTLVFLGRVVEAKP